MSQLVITEYGDVTTALKLDESPDRTLGADDVLVALEAAPINPSDFLLAGGYYAYRPELPAPIGGEGVGRVVEAGSDVDPALVGRRVVVLPTQRQGTWGSRIVAPSGSVVPVSETADALQLAMLPINPATAYRLLTAYVDLEPGDWVGQNLGNSAVGQFVIALAKRAGLRTLSVVRREDAAEQVRALGGDVVLVDGDDLGDRIREALGGDELKLVLDGAGGSSYNALVGALELGGTSVVYASISGERPVLPFPDFLFRDLRTHGMFVVNWVRDAPREELEAVYAELSGLVEDGVLSAAVEATYPIEQYQEAIAHARRTGRGGKVLFTF